MPPRERDAAIAVPTEVEGADLQARIQMIAQQARKRNPDGFRLAPVDSLSPPASPPRRRESPTPLSGTFTNVHSGQEVVLLDCARNVPPHLRAAV